MSRSASASVASGGIAMRKCAASDRVNSWRFAPPAATSVRENVLARVLQDVVVGHRRGDEPMGRRRVRTGVPELDRDADAARDTGPGDLLGRVEQRAAHGDRAANVVAVGVPRQRPEAPRADRRAGRSSTVTVNVADSPSREA